MTNETSTRQTGQIPPPPPATRTRRRSAAAAGLTAGLIGGAAAGIAFGVPAVTGAADDGPAPALLQIDDPASDDAASDDAAPEADHGQRLREVLQPLVDDGTIDATQADAVVAHLLEHRPEGPGGRGGPGGHGRGPGRLEPGVVTDVLGIDADELREQLREGASLADVATANGVDPQELVDALVTEAEERLAQAVEDGRIDADEAAARADELEERITDRVNGDRPGRAADGPADDSGDTGDTGDTGDIDDTGDGSADGTDSGAGTDG